MAKYTTPKKRYAFILAVARQHGQLNGFVYWTNDHDKFNLYTSNRKAFISNYQHGFCTFTFHQVNQLYNFIRKHCGYHTLSVAKTSKCSIKTLQRKLDQSSKSSYKEKGED